MVDKAQFLELIDEFSELINLPDNRIYREGERRLDYLGLMVFIITGAQVGEVKKGDQARVAWVYTELSELLQTARYDELVELKEFLEDEDYRVRVTPGVHETTFVVHARNYDLTIIID